MKWTRVGLILVLGLALFAGVVAGCFIGGGGAACYQEDPMACTDFTGVVYTKAMVKESCDYKVRSSCPTEDAVGTCSLNTNGPNELVIYYYAPAESQQTAEETCDAAGGNFKAL